MIDLLGAPGRTRTSTTLRPPDFESGASTNSATGARRRNIAAGGGGSTWRRLRRRSRAVGRWQRAGASCRGPPHHGGAFTGVSETRAAATPRLSHGASSQIFPVRINFARPIVFPCATREHVRFWKRARGARETSRLRMQSTDVATRSMHACDRSVAGAVARRARSCRQHADGRGETGSHQNSKNNPMQSPARRPGEKRHVNSKINPMQSPAEAVHVTAGGIITPVGN